MSLRAVEEVNEKRPRHRLASLTPDAFRLLLVVFAALGAGYVAMCVKTLAMGGGSYGYADFRALWASGVLAHEGAPLANYDSVALHAKQVLLGVDPHRDNPFPYPPTFLLMLAPLGALPLPVAFWLFMGLTAAGFLAAMAAGRASPIWAIAALAAPAGGVTLVAGQGGLLWAALAIGGLRLGARRPRLAGVLLGALACKPQLGVLIPIALVAAGLWRVAAAAAVALLAGVLASSLAFGFALWPAWAREIATYASGYDATLDLMPTVYANLRGASLPPFAAMAAQLACSVAVACVVWRAFRSGAGDRGIALLTVGTFLATPHTFNYDMPLTTFALAALAARSRPGIPLVEVAILAAAFLSPLAILVARQALQPWSFLPCALLFAWLAFRRGALAFATGPC